MKTILGLDNHTYIRHFLFGVIIFMVICIFVSLPFSGVKLNSFLLINFSINTLLYPLSRHAYEAAIDYLVRDKTEFWVSLKLLILIKFISILLCWALAIIIAPIWIITKFLFLRATHH